MNGLVTAVDPRQEFADSLRWDWYQATVVSDEFGTYPERLADALAGDLGAARVEVSRGILGYEHQAHLRTADGDHLARVLYGGSNRWANVIGSGDRAPRLAHVLRGDSQYRHAVTRADVALDVQGPDSFGRLMEECLKVADARQVSVGHAGDWHRQEKGRTLYIGSKKSELFARLYEKGLEQRGKAPNEEAAAAVPIDWTRLELVCKPQKRPRRLLAATAQPLDLWGWSLWTKALADAVMAVDVPRVERMSWARAEDAVSVDWMVRQWGPLLARLEGREGSWEGVGRLLGRLHRRNVEGVR